MTVRTRLQPRFLIQRIAMILICLVLGLWGVYDYAYAIPRDQAMSDRFPVYEAAFEAIRLSGDPEATPDEREAAVRTAAELITAAEAALPEGIEADAGDDPGLRPLDLSQWKAELELMKGTTVGYAALPPEAEVPDVLAGGARLIEARKNATAEVTPPSKFDRLTQWFFILCLPFVPYYLWTFVRELRQTHVLEEDGGFAGPHGRWEADEIADVDMSQWMRKSVAWVVHTDGRREKLDDYVHRGVDRIVGTLAHRLHPEQWTPEAKPVKKDEDGADGDAPGAGGGAAAEVDGAKTAGAATAATAATDGPADGDDAEPVAAAADEGPDAERPS